MKPEELDSVVDNIESITRIADALAGDSKKLVDVLKQIQRRPAAPSERADIFAYDELLGRTLIHYGIAPDSVRESLHETLLTQYAQLHSIDPTSLAGLLAKMRKPETHAHPTAVVAAMAEDQGPTPASDLQESLLELTDSLARRQAVPRPLGELVSQYFSPAILRTGRGFIRPSCPPALGSYSEDLLVVGATKALKWPSGWYKHAKISDAPDQFFLTMRNWAILIVELRSGIPTGYVAKLSDSDAPVEWMVYGDLSRGESLALCGEVTSWFEGFSEGPINA